MHEDLQTVIIHLGTRNQQLRRLALGELRKNIKSNLSELIKQNKVNIQEAKQRFNVVISFFFFHFGDHHFPLFKTDCDKKEANILYNTKSFLRTKFVELQGKLRIYFELTVTRKN